MMVNQMKHTNSSLHFVSGWQLFGELELRVTPDADRTIGKWLRVIFSPLNLHADFLNRVLKSAQEATVHAMRLERMRKFRHIHLLVFAPAERASNSQAWGFFKIGKIDDSPNRGEFNDHSIEIYLYLEG